MLNCQIVYQLKNNKNKCCTNATTRYSRLSPDTNYEKATEEIPDGRPTNPHPETDDVPSKKPCRTGSMGEGEPERTTRNTSPLQDQAMNDWYNDPPDSPEPPYWWAMLEEALSDKDMPQEVKHAVTNAMEKWHNEQFPESQ